MTAIKVGRRTGVARYQQVYTLLSRALHDGTIPPGSSLPTELELMRRYRVSRNTVRHALARLEREKRIDRRRGSGTFAREIEPGRPRVAMLAVPDDLQAAAAPGMSARTLHFGKTASPSYLRERWPLLGNEVLLVQRLWSACGQRAALCTLHIEMGIGRKLRRGLLAANSIFTVLRSLGASIGEVSQACTAVGADSIQGQQLGVHAGSPLLVLTRWIQDAGGQPLMHQQLAYPGALYEMRTGLLAEHTQHGPRLLPRSSHD